MRPVKRDDLTPAVASEFNLSEREVRDMVNFYWGEGVMDSVRNLHRLNLILDGIGEICFAKSRIEELEIKLTRTVNMLVSIGKSPLKYETLLVNLADLKIQREHEYQKRETVRQKRADYETKKDLDPQVENS